MDLSDYQNALASQAEIERQREIDKINQAYNQVQNQLSKQAIAQAMGSIPMWKNPVATTSGTSPLQGGTTMSAGTTTTAQKQ